MSQLKVELSRFRIKKGKEERVNEWMKLLNDRKSEVLLTLNDEKIFTESIFRERIGDAEYLLWYTIQGEGGIHVSKSEHKIDKLHVAFAKECIDLEESPIHLLPQVHFAQ